MPLPLRRRIHLSGYWIIFLLLQLPTAHGSDAALGSDTDDAAAGFYTLSWSVSEPARLVESTRADFSDARIIYSGEDTARVMSGKPNGDWHYRLESPVTGEPLTPGVSVTVRHHSLARAWSFFSVGAVVFMATLALILVGNRAAQRYSGGAGEDS